MRAAAAIMMLLGAAGPAGAQSPLAAEVRALADRYHENPSRIDALRVLVAQAAQADPSVDNLLALAQIAFLYGDVRGRTADEKLDAYEQGRQAARRAAELAPRNARAHFWYATNAGRWGQTKGVLRSLFLLPEVKRGMETALELDPRFPPAYVLAGTVYYEVPGLVRRRSREVRAPLPEGPRGGRPLHRPARRARPHPDQARARPGGAARAAGGARREGPVEPGGLDAEGRARGPPAPGRAPGPPVSIGHTIRRLRREAPGWRSTALAEVAAQWHDPFRVLVACLLSLRTKDQTTGPAAARLFALADTPEGMRGLTPRAIERAIYPVGFYRTKARVLREISRDLLARFGGVVPDDIDALLTLKGVGRKTANLVVTQGFNKPGICVDVHVHRISNRWGYVKTRNPGRDRDGAPPRPCPAATGSATTTCWCRSARTSACPSRPAARSARSARDARATGVTHSR